MPLEAENEARENASESLKRVQEFDVSELPREEDLGKSFEFSGAVEPATRLIELFRRLPISALEDFAQTQLDQVKKQADSCYNIFEQILNFQATQDNASSTRQSLISQLEGAYQGAFNILMPLIGYSLYKTADFQRLDTEARATLQSIKDEASSITRGLEEQKADAEGVLEEIRKVAAEQGVSQQAYYFKEEAEENATQAEVWRIRTIVLACILAVFAFLSLFIHEIPILRPENSYETVQLAISKVLIFAVISYILYLSARNFMSHKHNAVVNRHRQNALMTYNALVEAAGDYQHASDAILVHAASCIYAPQATGYAGGGQETQGAKSVIELLSRPFSQSGE
jgi:hypothetical protein